MKERILQFIEYKRLSKNKFYKETGLSNGILDKQGGISSDSLEKIYCVYPEINLERDQSFKGLADIAQALINNADKAFVRSAVATMATIVEAFKQYSKE